ncbi:TetR/AcrR family transcriptional regulator [Salinibacter ruber]|jgi:AcrR family transcriptional regulator|uniref:TetR/AcrR family transcriptional regulator n=1 Tax=Salinibacter ruber TaxID=146919 RepID=UPI00216A9636|nr:helix-turn-helix domain-containing protein [Salinibacter ruber]MCS4034426.1 AcrR family transcriptional regulator [Salinibacter ruber]MCS4050766.1 AcrR family transcriptional regulator [Salinibacter ruber]
MLRSAKVVFAERGFHQATVDEIAAVAGFGKGTLYNYFEEGKQEMLHHALNGIRRECLEITESALTGVSEQDTVGSLLEEFFGGLTSYFYANPVSFRVVDQAGQEAKCAGVDSSPADGKPPAHIDMTRRIQQAISKAPRSSSVREELRFPVKKVVLYGLGAVSTYLRSEAVYRPILPPSADDYEEARLKMQEERLLVLPSGETPGEIAEDISEMLLK